MMPTRSCVKVDLGWAGRGSLARSPDEIAITLILRFRESPPPFLPSLTLLRLLSAGAALFTVPPSFLSYLDIMRVVRPLLRSAAHNSCSDTRYRRRRVVGGLSQIDMKPP